MSAQKHGKAGNTDAGIANDSRTGIGGGDDDCATLGTDVDFAWQASKARCQR